MACENEQGRGGDVSVNHYERVKHHDSKWQGKEIPVGKNRMKCKKVDSGDADTIVTNEPIIVYGQETRLFTLYVRSRRTKTR